MRAVWIGLLAWCALSGAAGVAWARCFGRGDTQPDLGTDDTYRLPAANDARWAPFVPGWHVARANEREGALAPCPHGQGADCGKCAAVFDNLADVAGGAR